MGYFVDKNNVKNFWPDDTDTEIYLSGEKDLKSIINLVKEKWPNVSFENISIESVYIQTNCIGYDLYDSTDYTNFIKIIKNK